MTQLSIAMQRHARGWRGDTLALIAGALTPLGFAPTAWWPLAIIGPSILFGLWLFSSANRATWRGACFGLGYFGIGISWVFISIHFHGHVELNLSIFLTVLLILVMAAFPATIGYWLVRIFPQRFEKRFIRYKLLLVIPAIWAFSEWIRGWFMTGFPWLSLGYSQTDSPLAGLTPFVGVYGVSWAAALSAALLTAFMLDRSNRIFYFMGFSWLWLLAFAMQETHWTEPHGAPIKTALLQGNIPQDIKWHPDMRLPSITLYQELTNQNWDADLIVWPETALPAFFYETEPFLDDLESEAIKNNTDLLIGMLTLSRDKRRYYNTMISLGSGRERYHKNHLVPFTEYLPMKWLFGGLVEFMQVPMSDFSNGGNFQKPLHVARQRAAISICFEDAFGEEIIRQLPEATFLVNVSNDAWFDNSWAAPQHLQIARMRALETERPLLRATNTGMTAIIDAKGKIKAQAPQFMTTSISDTIQPRKGLTLYARVGNWPVIIGSILAVLIATWKLRDALLRVRH